MERDEMTGLYREHRTAEEARDLDAVVALFDDDGFVENVALGSRVTGHVEVRRFYEAMFTAFPDLVSTPAGEAHGDGVLVVWGAAHGTMQGPWLGLVATNRTFTCDYVDIVEFGDRRLAGRRLLFDLPALCRSIAVPLFELVDRSLTVKAPI